MVPLSWYLFLSAALFSIGLFGVLVRREAIAIMLCIELMLNAANINLIAFWRFHVQPAENVDGQVFALFVIAVAAAEVAVGLALIISIYRNRKTVNLDELDLLKG